jgi:hypothetical protein
VFPCYLCAECCTKYVDVRTDIGWLNKMKIKNKAKIENKIKNKIKKKQNPKILN